MKLWLLLGILSYLSYAISTSIDKHIMNKGYDVIKTNTFKAFFDGLILLIIGFVFFELKFTSNLILGSLILGVIFAFSGILYFTALRLRDVAVVMPYAQSSTILLVFISSLIIFNESANIFNFIGAILILFGAYAVLSESTLRFPKLDKVFCLISLMVILDLMYSLLAKKLLFDINPINLAIMMYFSATIILVIFQFIYHSSKRQHQKSLIVCGNLYKIIIAAFFGAMGTFLLYSALSVGDASKVYPIAGLQSVFVFIIAPIFLKERFYWHRLIGTITVFFGIFFISL